MKYKRNASLLLSFCIPLSAKRKKIIDNIYPICIELNSWEEAKMGKDKKNKNNNALFLPNDFLKTRWAAYISTAQSVKRKIL